MHMFVNTRKIAASKDKAYELIVDSEMWPNFIKECKKVSILEKKGNSFIRYMESTVNGRFISMETYCELFPDEYKVKFRQIKSPWPIKSNSGEWYVRECKDGTLEMVLIHCIEAKYGYIGDLLVKLIIGKHFVYNHAELVLSEFKHKLESDN